MPFCCITSKTIITMVKHIVCFKLAKPTDELRAATRDILLSMRGKVPTAQSIDVHLDQLHSSRSYDIILEVIVADWNTLDLYQNDPYHCNVVKKHMHAVAEASIALDFEL